MSSSDDPWKSLAKSASHLSSARLRSEKMLRWFVGCLAHHPLLLLLGFVLAFLAWVTLLIAAPPGVSA